MPDITTPRDLFLHELGDILYVEKKLTGEVLPKLIDEVQDPDFRKGLERHLTRPGATSRTSSRSSTRWRNSRRPRSAWASRG